jgi:hypothetical protein
MAIIRICAILTLGLLAAYYVLRVVATRCNGVQCDSYIPLSLLVPLLVLILAGVTGVLAIAAAMQRAQGASLGVLSACMLLGVLGPLGLLAVLRNSPADLFVSLATVLVLLVPLSALIYTFLAATPVWRPPAS